MRFLVSNDRVRAPALSGDMLPPVVWRMTSTGCISSKVQSKLGEGLHHQCGVDYEVI